jgi:catechol 2,3-dioxygenase-like lactoylglutathione lyase family enzyme
VIDHLTRTVRDADASVAFFSRVLRPLGYRVTNRFGEYVGFGTKRKPYFWLKPGEVPTTPMHLALVAPSRAAVDRFYQQALAAGAKDNGPPGLRPDYHPDYYAAFVTDVDGHNLEAVCHLPPARKPTPKRRPARRAAKPKKRGR